MSQYYMLLKNGLADFDKILIEKYSLIGLDEADAIILIKLKKILETNKTINETIIVKELVKTMSLSEKAISEKLVILINGEYISLKIINNKETYTLDDIYKRLGNIIDNDSLENDKEEKETDIKKTVSFIEKEFEHLINPTELDVIKHWIDVDKFTFAQIKDATLECIMLKKKNIKYIDTILNKGKTSSNTNNITSKDNLSELFSSVYGKIRK